MSNAAWPSTLPQYVLEQGYEEKLNDQTIETPMDVGPPKVRRRYTKQFRTFSLTVRLSPEQKATFESFWQDTLAGGSLPFDWVHPLTRDAMTFRFRAPAPKMGSVGGTDTMVSFTLQSV